ncbi:Retrovirus-related Pol polyprotein from transposon TNT 1-94 [Vitis vinifera]|uniref:Retrovirus-related Pol polyprotein from transposon TNT 1-94 n=1 Tax=Vitis vinifera TaxID=29760 RepID=A0A438GIW1_VITVI|nr:Retrovirus-related Pol polyprotein from transposon TNT 1-94 [Vitis vinifera]
MSKTLNDRAKSIRIHSGLPKTFSVDTVNIVAYLINRGPSIPLNCRILEEVWSSKKVFYKDRLGKVLDKANSEVRMPEVVNLKDFSMNDLQVNVNEVQETTLPEDQENVALESYEEVVQVDESTKWKLAMKVDEMDLLMSNQTWDREAFKLSQEEYVKKVLSRFNMTGVKPEAMKWILRYLRGTIESTLYFRKSNIGLQGYVDADMVGDIDRRKSTIRYVYTLGDTVSFLEELGHKYERSMLHCDNHSVIHLAKNPIYHARTKHIQVWHHFIKSALEDGLLTLEKIQGNRNPVDMLTKMVTIEKLELCATSVGLLD